MEVVGLLLILPPPSHFSHKSLKPSQKVSLKILGQGFASSGIVHNSKINTVKSSGSGSGSGSYWPPGCCWPW